MTKQGTGPPGEEIALDEADAKLVYRGLQAVLHGTAEPIHRELLQERIERGFVVVPDHAAGTVRLFDPHGETSEQAQELAVRKNRANRKPVRKEAGKRIPLPRIVSRYEPGAGRMERRAPLSSAQADREIQEDRRERNAD